MPYANYAHQNTTIKEGHFVLFFYQFVLRIVSVEIDSIITNSGFKGF